jgi:hypothetical protein
MVRPAFNRNREANTADSMLVLRCLVPRRIAPIPAPLPAPGLPSAAARGEQATVDGGSGAVPSAQVRCLFWGVEAKIAATANGRNVLVISVCVCVMLGEGGRKGGGGCGDNPRVESIRVRLLFKSRDNRFRHFPLPPPPPPLLPPIRYPLLTTNYWETCNGERSDTRLGECGKRAATSSPLPALPPPSNPRLKTSRLRPSAPLRAHRRPPPPHQYRILIEDL